MIVLCILNELNKIYKNNLPLVFMSYINSMPDDNNANLHLFILDPLSVIIKLAIISNKPIGTKLRIDNNVI